MLMNEEFDSVNFIIKLIWAKLESSLDSYQF